MTMTTHQATTKKHWVAHERKQGPPLKHRNDVAENTRQPANRSAPHSLISFEPHDASIKACRLAKQHGSDDQDRATAHDLHDAAFSGGTTAALLASSAAPYL